MALKSRKYWKALKCPICGERVVFYVTIDAVEGAKQFPVPFKVVHEDHDFHIYLDSGLLISRVEEKPPKKPVKKVKKTKKK